MLLKEVIMLNVQYYRAKKHMTYAQLAEETEKNRSEKHTGHLIPRYIQDVEAGKRIPNVDMVNAITKGLGITAQELIDTSTANRQALNNLFCDVLGFCNDTGMSIDFVIEDFKKQADEMDRLSDKLIYHEEGETE